MKITPEQHALIVQTAQQTLEIERDTLHALIACINEDFVSVVATILSLSGRVVITGIGKSAIVAQKIVATMNSTGTPALFMHAADAIHGDLGMITSSDVVICISKSGNTPEIKALVPLLKNRCRSIVGMVAHKESFLAQHADFVLLTPITREADPNNLAPTSSTTAQMALGDAIATALIASRGFQAQDFAHFHPGGALGKQLYLRVSDLVGLHGQPKVEENANLATIIGEITKHRLGATIVSNKENKVAGIITDGDLRRAMTTHPDIRSLHAFEIMSIAPSTIQIDQMATEALFVLREKSIQQLVVLDEQQYYCGMVHLHDLLREGIV